MLLVPLLFIILIVWAFVFLLRPTQSNPPGNTNFISVSNKPIEILNERYAKGEITEEEYLKVKRNLL